MRQLSAGDLQWYRERVSWFRPYRRKTKLGESFFPLGSWQQTSSATWDGYARLERSGRGIVALFRNEAPDKSAVVQLPLMLPGT